jgi:NitT/TauT family transport system ATP-binding protein
MQMRVSIARALASKPDLLLMDEPFGALDEFTPAAPRRRASRAVGATRLTVVFVTHSIYEAVFLSTRVAVMGARPRPRDRRAGDRRAASAQRRVPGLDAFAHYCQRLSRSSPTPAAHRRRDAGAPR